MRRVGGGPCRMSCPGKTEAPRRLRHRLGAATWGNVAAASSAHAFAPIRSGFFLSVGPLLRLSALRPPIGQRRISSFRRGDRPAGIDRW
jgi:hypothetical protein